MQMLIIEDNRSLAEGIAQLMQKQQFLVTLVDNGIDGLAYAQTDQYDIILLDIMLPRMHGLEIVRRLRHAHNSTPILLLTAKDEVTDKVAGLDCGADDYMTKPFDKDELLARVRALTRRQGAILSESITQADLSLNLMERTLHAKEKSVRLSNKEFELAKILLLNIGMVVPKSMLLERIWGMDSEAEDNNVEAYVSFLRKKLKFLNASVCISTIWGTGYVLEAVEGATKE